MASPNNDNNNNNLQFSENNKKIYTPRLTDPDCKSMKTQTSVLKMKL